MWSTQERYTFVLAGSRVQTTEQSGARHKTPACVCKVQQGYMSGILFPSCCTEVCWALPSRWIHFMCHKLVNSWFMCNSLQSVWVFGPYPWRVDPCPVAWALSKSGTSTASSYSVNWDFVGCTMLLSVRHDFRFQPFWCPQMLRCFFGLSLPRRAGLVSANQCSRNNKSEGLWPTKTTGTHLRKGCTEL